MSEERKTIYLCLAHMSDEGYEQKYVKEAFDTNWVVPMGPNVNAFEQDLALGGCVQTDEEAHEGGLAAAGFTDEAQRLALVEFQIDIVAGSQLSPAGCGETAGNMLCLEDHIFFIKHNAHLPEKERHPAASEHLYF